MEEQQPVPTATKNGFSTRQIVLIVVAISVVIVLAYIIFHPTPPSSTPVAQTSPAQAMPSVITITGTNYSFDKSQIIVKQGENITINFVDGNGFHNFVIQGYNITTPILNTGQKSTVTFVASKKGTFNYYSSVGTQQKMGMQGQLIVQ